VIDEKTLAALYEIFKFWFLVSLNAGVLIALFRSLKYIFNSCNYGYKFTLLECSNDKVIDIIGYGDLVKLFRKWLFLLIWITGSLTLISLTISKVLFDYESVFEWFNILWLYGFLLLSGLVSFPIIGSRCKRVKIKKC
jgi:hypothetical protein